MAIKSSISFDYGSVLADKMSPTVVSIRIDSGQLSDDCFEDEKVVSGHHRPPYGHANGHAISFWTNLGQDIRFIDDSARSSVASDLRRPSTTTSNCLMDSPGTGNGLPVTETTTDLLETNFLGNYHQRYSSLTTLTMSDRRSSADCSPDETSTLLHLRQKYPYHQSIGGTMSTNNHAACCYQQSPTSYVPLVPLKSCLVEVDSNGQRITYSCVSNPRQLSFQPNQGPYPRYRDHLHTSTKLCSEVPLSSSGQYVYYGTNKLFETAKGGGGGGGGVGGGGVGGTSGSNVGHRESIDAISQYSLYMEQDCRYYFQHPYSRLFVVYFVIFCNFLIFAEDPVSHSHTESAIPIVGNVFAFVITKYPPEWEWTLVKVFLWLTATIIGMGIGKRAIHRLLLARLCRLKMFHEEQGSWMIMFLTVIVTLYIFSSLYNAILRVGHPNYWKYQISSLMGIRNSSLMKAAACGTWLGDFVTAWMVTDMMLQDNLYPTWAPNIRAFWRTGNTRIVTFWSGAVGMSALVVTLIVSDLINWDKLNRDFVATTELSRAYLASFILVMDLLIVMQDWDFPHFTSTLDINLPGLKIKAVKLNFCDCPMNLQRFWKINITGKWFNYGIIFLVMILDINMWKNQIFYSPEAYGQYLGPDFKVYAVSDYDVIATGNRSLWTYSSRSLQDDPLTNRSYREGDMLMNSRYLGYSLEEKCTAFVPSMIGFFMFGLLVYLYGRFPPKEGGALGGRLKRRKKKYYSSWRRERGSFRLQHPHSQTQQETSQGASKYEVVTDTTSEPTSRDQQKCPVVHL